MPLPGHGIGHVNVYAISSADGWALVDTGWGVEHCEAALERALGVIGVARRDIVLVLLTHLHVDHCGLAGAIGCAGRTSVRMHSADAALLAPTYSRPGTDFRAVVDEWSRTSGLPDELHELALHQAEIAATRFTTSSPEAVHDGEVIAFGQRRITVVHTPGHTPGHVCYLIEPDGVLLAGDVVLPGINYGATLRPFQTADPLGDYFASLRRLAELAGVRVLPGHLDPYDDLAGRIDALRRHHGRRLGDVAALVEAAPRSVWDVASTLPRRRPWGATPPGAQLSAVGEAAAYLTHLEHRGALERRGTQFAAAR